MIVETNSAASTIENKIKSLEQEIQLWNAKSQEFDNAIKQFIADPKAEGNHMSIINGALTGYKEILKNNMTTINGALIGYKESFRLISQSVEEVPFEILEPVD